VYGELALGGARPQTLSLLTEIHTLAVAPLPDVMAFVRRYRATGIGWVDVNLLVSALEAGADILTFDDDLRRNATLHGRSVAVG
jgi:hypothetical protein